MILSRSTHFSIIMMGYIKDMLSSGSEIRLYYGDVLISNHQILDLSGLSLQSDGSLKLTSINIEPARNMSGEALEPTRLKIFKNNIELLNIVGLTGYSVIPNLSTVIIDSFGLHV